MHAGCSTALTSLALALLQVDTEGHIATWGSSGSLSRHHTGRLGGSSSRHAASQVQNGSSINGTNGEAAAAAAAAGREVAAPETSSKSETGAQGGGAPEAAPDAAAAAAGEARPPSKVLRWMLREERARVPPVNFALLVAGLTGLVVTKVASSTALACGSWQSWVLQCSVVPILGLIYLAARAHVLRKQRVLGAYRPTPPALDPDSPLSGLSAANGYLHFTARNTLAIAAVCVVAGIIAGLVGLGGGIVLVSVVYCVVCLWRCEGRSSLEGLPCQTATPAIARRCPPPSWSTPGHCWLAQPAALHSPHAVPTPCPPRPADAAHD